MAQAQPKSREIHQLQNQVFAAVGLPEFDFIYKKFIREVSKIEHTEPSEYFYFRAQQAAFDGDLSELDRFVNLALYQNNSQEQRCNLATTYIDLGLYCSAHKVLSPLYSIQGKAAAVAGMCAMMALLNGNTEQAVVELNNINTAYPNGKGVDATTLNNLTQVNCLLEEITLNALPNSEITQYQQCFEKLVRQQLKPALKSVHAELSCAYPGVYPLISVDFNGVASEFSAELVIHLANLLSDETACFEVSSAVKMLFNVDFNAVDVTEVKPQHA